MNATTAQQQLPSNTILHGDCIEILRSLPAQSADFILTDPPYLVNYRDRSGRTIQNDCESDWLRPAMAGAYRALKQDRLMLCFYGWTKVDAFFAAWKDAGFQPVGHLVFRKAYSSSSRFLRYQHEQAYLLAKGRPPLPKQALADVIDMPYSGNFLHPTQKPVAALAQLIRSFTLPGELVLDCFAGSGSTCAAAMLTGRRYLGIELDELRVLEQKRSIVVAGGALSSDEGSLRRPRYADPATRPARRADQFRRRQQLALSRRLAERLMPLRSCAGRSRTRLTPSCFCTATCSTVSSASANRSRSLGLDSGLSGGDP